MIEVAAAIIDNEQGQILIARRKKGKSQEGMWEFPGGKIEKRESVQACLRSELMEKMQIEILPYAIFGVNDHYYGCNLIRLFAYKVTHIRGVITLVDNDDYRWICREYPSM